MIPIEWQAAQTWESQWHGTCINTYGEEEKQLLYADRMGLKAYHDGKSPYNFDLTGVSVLDIGGGPVSLLLKCTGLKRSCVVDPIVFPDWVLSRYKCAGIGFVQACGEDIAELGWDECWMYNVLQHTRDPQAAVSRAREAARIIRVFEWIDIPISRGHPHLLTRDFLNKWLGGEGRVERIDEHGCNGFAYYGVFLGSEMIDLLEHQEGKQASLS